MPDISNIVALARLFKVTVNKLVGNATVAAAGRYLYESVTEFDVAEARDFDFDCNVDMEIVCRTLEAPLELNQLNATSRIAVPT